MSKLYDKQLHELYELGRDQWLGRTRKEIADRLRQKDDSISDGMLADLIEREIALPQGRPIGSVSQGQAEQSRKAEIAETEYRTRAADLRQRNALRGKSQALLREIAEKHGLAFEYLQNYVRRSKKNPRK